MGISLAFTGSRPKNLYGEDDVVSYLVLYNKIGQLLSHLLKKYPIDEVYTGGAPGIDQLVLRAAIARKEQGFSFENNVILPYGGFSSNSDSYMFSGKSFVEMQSKVDHLYSVSKRYYKGVFFDRNKSLVDSADALIAISLYKPVRSNGGTDYTVNYALSKGKPVYWWNCSERNHSFALQRLSDNRLQV